MPTDELQTMIEHYLEGSLPGGARRQLESLLEHNPEVAEHFARLAREEGEPTDRLGERWNRYLHLLFGYEDTEAPRRIWLLSLMATASLLGQWSTAGKGRGQAAPDALPGPGASQRPDAPDGGEGP